MNLDNIFNTFGDNVPLQEKAALIMLHVTQEFKLCMFKKIILNNYGMPRRIKRLKSFYMVIKRFKNKFKSY